MQNIRSLAIDAGLRAAAMVAIALWDGQAAPDDRRIAQAEQKVDPILAAEADLRAIRGELPECAEGCLTPSEAVATAFSAGPDQRVKGRFLLHIRGGGVSRPNDLEHLYFLNSEADYRTFGSLTLAFEPEAMKRLLNPPRVVLRRSLEEGDIIVERGRPRRRVALNVENMMERFENRRLIIYGEVGRQWITYYGTKGREGVRGEGYYQVWVRVASADQVTVLDCERTAAS